MIGQVLYLEAEALGIRATGIGCFFDDPVHELLELAGPTFQSLYHFTVGGPIDDPRLEASPAYESLRHQEFPPYSYVPGQRARRPHPSRDPAGHAYGTPTPTPAPLDPSRWRHNPTYLRGLALFDRGYYWEAHEMFEALWVAAGRTGAVAELLQALVQLAAVGIKVRQGLGDAVIRLANAAAAHIARARKLAGDGQLAGLDLARLAAFADHVVRHGAQLHGSPDAAVEIVFAHRLEPAER